MSGPFDTGWEKWRRIGLVEADDGERVGVGLVSYGDEDEDSFVELFVADMEGSLSVVVGKDKVVELIAMLKLALETTDKDGVGS